MDFSALNKVAKEPNLPRKTMTELPDDTKYKVTKVKQLTTKYGFSVVVHLNDEFQLFLPKRIASVLDDNRPLLKAMTAKATEGELILHHITESQCEFL